MSKRYRDGKTVDGGVEVKMKLKTIDAEILVSFAARSGMDLVSLCRELAEMKAVDLRKMQRIRDKAGR